MKVLIITTGGTIAEAYDDEQGGATPHVTGKDLINSLPGIEKLVAIEVIEFTNIDSRNVNLDFFRGLTKTIKHSIVRDDICALIITHGKKIILHKPELFKNFNIKRHRYNGTNCIFFTTCNFKQKANNFNRGYACK